MNKRLNLIIIWNRVKSGTIFPCIFTRPLSLSLSLFNNLSCFHGRHVSNLRRRWFPNVRLLLNFSDRVGKDRRTSFLQRITGVLTNVNYWWRVVLFCCGFCVWRRRRRRKEEEDGKWMCSGASCSRTVETTREISCYFKQWERRTKWDVLQYHLLRYFLCLVSYSYLQCIIRRSYIVTLCRYSVLKRWRFRLCTLQYIFKLS